jgi:DNA-binding PadR family transcriptional regulator
VAELSLREVDVLRLLGQPRHQRGLTAYEVGRYTCHAKQVVEEILARWVGEGLVASELVEGRYGPRPVFRLTERGAALARRLLEWG